LTKRLFGNRLVFGIEEPARDSVADGAGQWYRYLDELDEASRRRRHRTPAPDPPADRSRDDVAARVAREHLLVDSSIREVFYLPQAAPPDEIRQEVPSRLPPEWSLDGNKIWRHGA
jgi:hypothetical protein